MSLNYDHNDFYLLVNGSEIINFEAKRNIPRYILALDSITSCINSNKANKIGLSGSIFEFSVKNKLFQIYEFTNIHT